MVRSRAVAPPASFVGVPAGLVARRDAASVPAGAGSAPRDDRPARTAADPGSGDGAAPMPPARRWAGLALLVLTVSWVSLFAPIPGSLLPLAWPASGLLAGALLGAAPRPRIVLLVVGAVAIALAHLAHGFSPELAVSLAVVCAVEAAVVHRVLTGPDGHQRPALLDDGDVSRLIGAVALGAGVGSLGYAAILASGGQAEAVLCLVGVWGTHAASLMVLLPLFMRMPDFPPIAPPGERVAQWLLVLVTSGLVAAVSDVPPLLFIVMPMFAWLGYRSTLREATWLLVATGILTTTMTALGRGPVVALGERYDLAPELVAGYLQLFLLDCGLILLPLAVSVALQRNAAAEAAAGRDTLERLLSSATMTAILATDAAGRIVVFNPGAEAMLGYDAAEVLGDPPDRFHPPDELQRLARELGTRPDFCHIGAAIARSDEPRRLWTFRRRDGSTGTMLMTAAPLPAGPQGAGGLLCTAEDVTERERAQAALVATLEHREAAVARLEELDRIRSDFVSTVSHELRTPITSIIGFTEMLQDAELDRPEDRCAAVDRISRNSRRLLCLIEDLLTASQVQSSDLAAVKEPCDLRDPVAGAVDAASDVVSGRDLALEVALPDEPVAYLGDAGQLERMVLNLLTNAIKFTPDGGSVGVRVVPGGGEIGVVVQDTGMGIPEDEQEQLFTRFFRSSTAAEMAVQGTGLGLTIVQAIAALHGGEVGIVSAAGCGTTVTVSLPRPAATERMLEG